MLRIEMETKNSSFKEAGEVERVLAPHLKRIRDRPEEAFIVGLLDTNGNIVGYLDYRLDVERSLPQA